MKLKLIVVSALAFQLAACATVTRGKNQNVEFQSSPSDASVIVTEALNGLTEQTCTTPCELELKRNDTLNLTMEKPGYETFTMVMKASVSTGGGAAAAGNIIAGGIIGGIIDGSSGAMKSFDPDPVNVVLAPVGTGKSMLSIEDLDDEDGEGDS